MANILTIHGPNLNLLGRRNQELYGVATLDAINDELANLSKRHNHSLETFQSNSEGVILDKLQSSLDNFDFLIINPAGLGHTSVALRDTLECLPYPFVEVHLSNTNAREEFRHISLTQDLAMGVIQGFGKLSYILGLQAAINYLETYNGS